MSDHKCVCLCLGCAGGNHCGHPSCRGFEQASGDAQSLRPGDRVKVVSTAWESSIGRMATVESIADGGQVATVKVDGEAGTLSTAIAGLRRAYDPPVRGPTVPRALYDEACASLSQVVNERDALRDELAAQRRESARTLSPEDQRAVMALAHEQEVAARNACAASDKSTADPCALDSQRYSEGMSYTAADHERLKALHQAWNNAYSAGNSEEMTRIQREIAKLAKR